MKMPDPARRERQRALIEKGIETPFVRDHIKVFKKNFGEMEAQLRKTKGLASDTFTLADITFAIISPPAHLPASAR